MEQVVNNRNCDEIVSFENCRQIHLSLRVSWKLGPPALLFIFKKNMTGKIMSLFLLKMSI